MKNELHIAVDAQTIALIRQALIKNNHLHRVGAMEGAGVTIDMDGILLFCTDMPASAAYAPGNVASMAAARKIKASLTGLRARVLQSIKDAGQFGATGSEVAEDLGVGAYSAKPRCTELRDAGYIKDVGTRKNAQGNLETVWVSVDIKETTGNNVATSNQTKEESR